MLISIKHEYVVLQVPKCGSSSIQQALSPHCDFIITGEPALKHTRYAAYRRFVYPYLRGTIGKRADAFEIFALFRDPLEWLHSFYRYRQRPQLADPSDRWHHNYTGQVDFETFMNEYLSWRPKQFAKVGKQTNYLTDRIGRIGPITIYRHHDIDLFVEHIGARINKPLRLKRVNVSEVRTPLRLTERRRLYYRKRLCDQYEVFDQLPKRS